MDFELFGYDTPTQYIAMGYTEEEEKEQKMEMAKHKMEMEMARQEMEMAQKEMEEEEQGTK